MRRQAIEQETVDVVGSQESARDPHKPREPGSGVVHGNEASYTSRIGGASSSGGWAVAPGTRPDGHLRFGPDVHIAAVVDGHNPTRVTHAPCSKTSAERRLMRSERGFSLIETAVSIAILSIIAVGFLSALGASSKAVLTTDEHETARNLAQSQMEYVMNQTYAPSYVPSPISSEYAGCSAAITTDNITSRDGDIQKIRVTVSHQGIPIIMAVSSNWTLEGFKVKR